MTDNQRTVQHRILLYLLVAIAIPPIYIAIGDVGWIATPAFHTLMETLSAVLALIAGAMALLRYYARRDVVFLAIGTGLLGAACLDGYHALVTSPGFVNLMPSEPASLAPWSWMASRTLLALSMVLSYWGWRYEQRAGGERRISERSVYLFAIMFTLLSATIFSLIPVPPAYFSGLLFPRPEEFLPAALFLVALIGYLAKGRWRTDAFEHWLVLSLLIAFIGHGIVMSSSGALLDAAFNLSHILKNAAYACVLIGLMASMFNAFRQEAEHLRQMRLAHDRAASALAELASHKEALDDHAIVGVTDTSGIITYANKKFSEVSGYTSEELIGQDHRILNSGHHTAAYFRDMYRTIANGQTWHGEFRNRAKDGRHYWVETTITPFRDAAGKIEKYVAIRTDVTALKKAEKEIAQSRDLLAKANTQKDQFFLIIAHDLRGPFDNLLGYSELLVAQAKLMDREKIAKYSELVHRTAEETYNLLEDLFEWARLQLDQVQIELEPVDIAEIIDANFSLLEPMAEAKQIVMSTRTDGTRIETDARMVDAVLRNLISNAIKFTRAGGQVSVRAEARGGRFLIEVTDNGVGMSPDQVRQLFRLDRFQSRLGTGGEIGTGLGLFLCREMIDKLDGEIHARSAEGQGTTMTFTLPLREPTSVSPANAAAAEQEMDEAAE